MTRFITIIVLFWDCLCSLRWKWFSLKITPLLVTHLDKGLQLIRSNTRVSFQEQSLLPSDTGLLVALISLLQCIERQTATDQVQKDHNEHSQHCLPFHHWVEGCCRTVAAGIHAGHHASRAGGDGQAWQWTVAVSLGVTAHGVLHGGHTGLDKTGLCHARLDLFGRDQVGLDCH